MAPSPSLPLSHCPPSSFSFPSLHLSLLLPSLPSSHLTSFLLGYVSIYSRVLSNPLSSKHELVSFQVLYLRSVLPRPAYSCLLKYLLSPPAYSCLLEHSHSFPSCYSAHPSHMPAPCSDGGGAAPAPVIFHASLCVGCLDLCC